MSEVDPAHILFPSDAPKAPAAAPEWFKAEQAAATTRLMGGGKVEAEKKPAGPAGDDAGDAAATLFANEGKEFDASVVNEFFDPHTLGAFSEGDKERGEALKAATTALTEDFRAAGTNSDDLKAAFDIVREANDFVVPPTPEKIEADMTAGLATLQGELGTTYESDLTAARAFIRDLEVVAPGTIQSLEHNGAGNDLRLVRAAIKEAKRRGYGTRR